LVFREGFGFAEAQRIKRISVAGADWRTGTITDRIFKIPQVRRGCFLENWIAIVKPTGNRTKCPLDSRSGADYNGEIVKNSNPFTSRGVGRKRKSTLVLGG
jgi:hypothetical protein